MSRVRVPSPAPRLPERSDSIELPLVDAYELPEAAQRSGVGVDELRRLVELGIITPDAGAHFRAGHLRRVGLVNSLVASGIPLEGLAAAIRGGSVALDFLDAPAFDRFSALSGATFAETAERTGLPVELLMFIREVSGSVGPDRTIDCVTRSCPSST